MDLSKLSQNEKLALYGSVALIVGGIVGYSYGITALGILAAVAMLVIIFLPQMSPNTGLPGSKGSLMVAAGGLAGVAMVLALLSALDSVFTGMNFRDVFFLIAVAGGLLMAWAGWSEFQSEGGKFQLGSSASTATPPAAAPDSPAAAPSAAPEPAQAVPPPAAEPSAAEPVATEPTTYAGEAPRADAPADTDEERRPPA
jgi:hypothetical protein